MQHVRGLHQVQELSVRGEVWRQHDFSQYDAVIHVAAIVHQPLEKNRELYRKVNQELPCEVCSQAVAQGVKHFVFFSTMAVYGIAPSRNGGSGITSATTCHPRSLYGKSKWVAEQELLGLQQKYSFDLSLVRPPMIYGKHCPGNYFKRLMWMGRHLPVFPAIRKNRLSMLGIDNLCELLRMIVENQSGGLFQPDDQDGIGTEERLDIIAKAYGKHIRMSKLLGMPVSCLPIRALDSLYGDLYYACADSLFGRSYVTHSFADTIRICID